MARTWIHSPRKLSASQFKWIKKRTHKIIKKHTKRMMKMKNISLSFFDFLIVSLLLIRSNGLFVCIMKLLISIDFVIALFPSWKELTMIPLCIIESCMFFWFSFRIAQFFFTHRFCFVVVGDSDLIVSKYQLLDSTVSKCPKFNEQKSVHLNRENIRTN